MGLVNRALAKDSRDHEFATAWFGILDAESLGAGRIAARDTTGRLSCAPVMRERSTRTT